MGGCEDLKQLQPRSIGLPCDNPSVVKRATAVGKLTSAKFSDLDKGESFDSLFTTGTWKRSTFLLLLGFL